ncbi:MAG: hypothetical protein WCY84_00675, partial [Candidatus Cloacimonadaceae bacterium]
FDSPVPLRAYTNPRYPKESSMKFEEFKSGVYRNQYQYKSFLPSTINLEWAWDDPRINVLLENATRALGELNAFSIIVPNVDLFIRMHILKAGRC